MGKSVSQKTLVADYYMSIHFGICLGSTSVLKKIWIGEKEAWSGNLTAATPEIINKPDLFGGLSKEGGAVGAFTYLNGNPSQL